MKFDKVTKKEFKDFVSNYPNKLDWDVTTICEPPMGNYNDFTKGKVWPESMVAIVRLMDGYPYPNEYFILKP